MSKLTTRQIAATLDKLRATAARATGKRLEKAERSIACYEEELRNRIAAGEADPDAHNSADTQEQPATPAAAARPARIETPYPPDDSVRDAEDMIRKWGTTGAVRALCVALNQHTAYADSMDISEAPRVIAMQQRYA